MGSFSFLAMLFILLNSCESSSNEVQKPVAIKEVVEPEYATQVDKQQEDPAKKRITQKVPKSPINYVAPQPIIPVDPIDPEPIPYMDPVPEYESYSIQRIEAPSIGQLEEEIMQFPEESAHYDGGVQEMNKFIQATLIYPKDAEENTIQGKVFIRFVVRQDGSITDVKIARGIYPSLDNESLRIVKLMPKWIPAKNKGKVVNSQFILPILYKLD
jgi:TonB family protein